MMTSVTTTKLTSNFQAEHFSRRQSLKQKLFWLLTLFLALSLAGIFSNSATAATISAGKTFVIKDGTQVVFDLDANVKPKVQILYNPQRLVIDLPGSKVGRLNSGLEKSPDIKALRVGQHGNSLRIVIELKGPYHGRAAIVKDKKYRLVADIFRTVLNTPQKKPKAKSSKTVKVAAKPKTPLLKDKSTTKKTPKKAATPKKTDKAAKPKWPEKKKEPAKKTVKKAEQKKTVKAKAKAKPKEKAKVKAKPKPTVEYTTRKIRVIIDAGHGRHDSGAVGPSGVKEKDVVLKIAKKLAKLIDKNPKMEAIMTRKSDRFLKLYDRVSKARKKKGDLFISIHANAVPKSSPKNQAGAMVFILNRRGATSKLAKYLEQSENNSGKIGGQDIIKVDKDVRDLVYGMVQGAVIDESRILASHIIKQMKKAKNVFKYSIEGANFAVLSAPDIPSVLVETTFITTPKEEKKLKSNSYQEKLAKAIYKGVVGFTKQRSHIGREAK